MGVRKLKPLLETIAAKLLFFYYKLMENFPWDYKRLVCKQSGTHLMGDREKYGRNKRVQSLFNALRLKILTFRYIRIRVLTRKRVFQN